MTSLRNAGRVVGALTLVQLSLGLLVNLVLVSPLFRPPGILANAAAHSLQVAVSVVLALVAALIALGVAIQVHLVVHRHAAAFGLWLLALATVTVALAAVEQVHLASMLSLSMAYTTEGLARDAVESLKLMVSASRNWSHYIGLVLTGCMIVSLYAALLRASLIPRMLGLFGIAAAALYTLAVAMPLFGQGVAVAMLVPLALSQLALSLWLIARGFAEPATATQAQDDV